MIETMTQTGIRTQAVIFQLRSVNAQTVNDPLLDEILNYCIPRRLLKYFVLFGIRGNEGYAKLCVSIDYDEHERRTTVEGDGSFRSGPVGVHAEFYGPRGDVPAEETDNQRECPVWRQAVNWFITLIHEENLTLDWIVAFGDQRKEMCRRFGLEPSTIVDCTVGSESHAIANSVLPELTAAASFSKALWPDTRKRDR